MSDDNTDTLVIELAEPLKLAGASFDRLALREPTVAQVERAMAKPTTHEQMRALISAVAAMPYTALGALPASTYAKANAYLMNYLGAPDPEPGDDADRKSLTVTLAEPIEVSGRTFDEVTLTEPTLAMLETSGKAGSLIAQDIELMVLAGSPSGVTRPLVEKMHFTDFARGRAFLSGFLVASAPNA